MFIWISFGLFQNRNQHTRRVIEVVITGLTRNQVIPHGTEGSNPSLSAKKSSRQAGFPDFSFLSPHFSCSIFRAEQGRIGTELRRKQVFGSISPYSNSPSASDLALASLSLHLLAKSVALGNAIPLTMACAEESYNRK